MDLTFAYSVCYGLIAIAVLCALAQVMPAFGVAKQIKKHGDEQWGFGLELLVVMTPEERERVLSRLENSDLRYSDLMKEANKP